MSMDDTMKALRQFEKELSNLRDSMQASATELEHEHDQVSALWRDQFARDYHLRWDAFKAGMHRFLTHDAPRYQAFVTQRINHLARYLGHG